MSLSGAPVFRLRPRNSRAIEALQGVLDLGDWSEQARLELNERLSRFQPDYALGWSFVMVASELAKMKAFLNAIGDGPRPFSTIATWNALLPAIRRDTGEILCSQRTIAETAGVSQADVCRALKRLAEMGVLVRDRPGRYCVHPAFAWKGTLSKREQVAKVAPQLSLIGD